MGGPSEYDLVRWSEALAGVARSGLAFTTSLYERERYDEVLRIAADMRRHGADAPSSEGQFDEWIRTVRHGAEGYATPKLAVGAIVGNADGELLLVKRAGSGVWLYPTGWADIGYSAAEVAVREVREETGIECEAVALVALVDGLRAGFHRIPLHSAVFHCRATGGALVGHPLETTDVGWFALDALPRPLAGDGRWVELASGALEGGPAAAARFDAPRTEHWNRHTAS
ncbi:MAG: NUDIX hydrolase N-terminal domain-containing protein [Actinobacteria bacterium]|nr:NUDIX hydrolase N-terminal domain-containing protein [Actinomycetota bacterium]